MKATRNWGKKNMAVLERKYEKNSKRKVIGTRRGENI